MHNLKPIRYATIDAVSEDITKLCWDPAESNVVFSSGPSETSATVSLTRMNVKAKTKELITSWEAPPPTPDLSYDSIVDLHHLSDTATTCVVFAGGDIVTVQEPSGSSTDAPASLEIIGSLDVGISAACWSPDEEILVIVSKKNTVSFMGRDFSLLAELPMTADDLSLSKHVSVGWGKKETQFEGRGAKALRDPTIPLKVDQGQPSPYEDGVTTITWHGDATCVAINAVVDGSRRAIRVYTRDGMLDGVSEPVDGLESALSWRPSGNLIAGVQRTGQDIKVVFFERNGLRHGDFMLRDCTAQNVRLHWNCDSTVLAVHADGELQLWTMGNYHWYLKQVFSSKRPIRQISWHSEKPLMLSMASSSAVYAIEYAFTIARGSLTPPKDLGAVAVIDGTSLLVTPFASANVPPPMALLTLPAKSPISHVAFSSNNSVLAVINSSAIEFYAIKTKNGKFAAALSIAKIELSAQLWQTIIDISPVGPRHFILTEVGEENSPSLNLITVDPSSKNVDVIKGMKLEDISPVALGIPSNNGFLRVEGSGNIFRIDTELGCIIPSMAVLPNNLPNWAVVTVNGSEIGVGLSRNGVLYAGKRVLAKNCTSFLITPNHIVFTTSAHLVKFVHLTETAEAMEVPADDPEVDERCRNIERGGKLVTAMPTQMCIVLQMPRGNLETIYPRAMVVEGIRQLIDQNEYGQAFGHCRTHRVDMNLLFDHQPKQFLSNVNLFLEQVKTAASIDLFLSSLKEENVAQTMYRDTKSQPKDSDEKSPEGTQGGKVNSICNAVLQALQAKKEANLQNIITAHVCKLPPATDDGLLLVAQLQTENEELAEKAVEHICFLVDVNMLYDHALGLYNLPLALLVAQQSQKDPREYSPFIQSLHELPETRRKFTIDDHLGRREKALGHLKDLGVFEEFCSYTVKHSMHKLALSLFRYDAEKHAALTLLYAQYLEANSKNQEAGIAYESLNKHAEAAKCYRAAGASCWQECLYNAQIQTPALSASEMQDLATTLAEALYEAKDYEGAATVNADYLDSLEEAVRCLCKGYLFSSAIRIVTLKNRHDLLSAVVDPGIVEALSNTTEFLAQCKSQLSAQVPRIMELRARAAEDPLAFYEGERHGGDVPDDISVAASSRMSTGGASLFTRYTGTVGSVGTGVSRATSKNRRREEKKRARGRKGTVYEEEYLINSVRRLIERVGGSLAETERLVAALVRRNMQERARAVEKLFIEMTDACKIAGATVFDEPEPEKPEVVEGMEGEFFIPSGADSVLMDSLRNMKKKQEPPIIKALERLSLLG
ncbi:Elongator complex protein 1 [Ceratocystis fimbriata CBS 114723]|uniref:Elongator complex protein 1 n=1 Tax=Ceratocystis fimbriata CBS 114723 TaxID=1035309 RepID=A0A2C5XJ53_9PEZI|nr:Elongator complex protein 1 [Ceratocystis fimbriata CBS 114723]